MVNLIIQNTSFIFLTNIIIVGPQITSFPPEQYGTVEGAENVRFECVVSSNPMATVHWFIDNQLYNGSSPDLYDITNTTSVDPLTEDTVIRSSFHIKKVRKEDLANYTCQAINNVIGQGEKMTNKSTTLIISRECVSLIICLNFEISRIVKIVYFCK